MQFVTISGALLFAFPFIIYFFFELMHNCDLATFWVWKNIDKEDNIGENEQVNTRYPLRAFPELPMIIKLRNGREKHENVKGVFMTNSLIAFNCFNMDYRLKGKESKRDTLLEKSEYLNEALHI